MDDFVEVLSPQDQASLSYSSVATTSSKYVDVYVAQVHPRECGALVKQLGGRLPQPASKQQDNNDKRDLTPPPRIDLSHLRRVRRRQQVRPTPCSNDEGGDNSATATKDSSSKPTVALHVVLGAVADVNRIIGNASSATTTPLSAEAADYFQTKYNLTAGVVVTIESLPARMAESEQELREFDQSWPTVYFANRTKEHLQQERRLNGDTVQYFANGLRAALDDAFMA